MSRVEPLILSHLLYDEPFLRTVIPFIKEEYFSDLGERFIVAAIKHFVDIYNAPPSLEALQVEFQKERGIKEDELKHVVEILKSIPDKSDSPPQWLLDTTENFCKERAVFNAIARSIAINDGRDEELTKDAIPNLLQEALSVCFDSSVGHDYIGDADDRFAFYNREEERLPFDLEMLNKITQGGVPRKTLNIIMAPTGVGKTIVLCHLAAAYKSQGKNVLYITMEMAEERIAERVDANLMNVSINEVQHMGKDQFDSRMERIQHKAQGSIIIKEYPTAGAHAGHFRALLSELKTKKRFTPDVILIDYINICASSRFKMSGSITSYTFIKSIAEEIRGLAVEQDAVVWSAIQTNRGGFNNSELELTDSAESMGVPHTADLMIALISTDELEKLGQIIIKQLKNRYNNLNYYKKFIIGMDKDKMRLYDVERNVQVPHKEREKEEIVPYTPNERFTGRDYGSIKI